MPTISGIASGIDTNAIVNQLVAAARGPIRQMQTKIGDNQFRRAKLEQLNTLMTNLQTQVALVDEIAEFPTFTATSSDDDSLLVSVSGESVPGTYTVSVDQKAQSTQQQSGNYAAVDTTLKDGTLTVTVGSTVTSVTIDSATGTDSVSGLAAYLTNSVPGVTAYVLDTGASSDPYKLIVTGSDTGLDYGVSLSVSQTGPTGEDLAFTESRAAADAQITVDSNTVTRSSNSITDVVPGLSFNLLAVTTGSLDVTVARDSAAMVAKVDDVVTAYNALNDYFDDNSGPDADPLISADQTLRTIQRGLQSIVSSGYSTSNVAGLNSIGMGTDQYGELQFDSAEFSTMLGSNWEDVLSMLTGTSGLFGALTAKVDADIDPTDGLIQPRLDSIDSRITDLNDRILDAERRLEIYEETLQMQFIAMETTLAKYQATESYLEAQIAQWNRNK